MPFLTWTNEYSVNVREIDAQHRKLMDMINRLYDAMREGRGAQATGQVLRELIDYTRAHFAYEERLLSQHGYPEFPGHKSEHDRLARKVTEFQQKFAAGNTMLALDLSKFLKDWLTTHILGTDKKYAAFLNGRGVA